MNNHTENNRFNILCLDGGGAKGFYTLGFLRELEATLGLSLSSHFDAIYGTSTGSIIASLVGLGKTAIETLKLYEDNVPNILGVVARQISRLPLDELPMNSTQSRSGVISRLALVLLLQIGQKRDP